MKILSRTIPLAALLLLLCACKRQTPVPQIMADTFFFGHAYLDANGNGQIDEDDLGLEDAVFQVSSDSGMGSRGTTGENGSAWIIFPGGLRRKDWPVTARMTPPEGTAYVPITPAEVVLEYPGTSADFLFAEP
jgi:hypothetical protein